MTVADHETLILASGSAARAAMLSGAGVDFIVETAGVDEDAIKVAMAGATPQALAIELACAKALAVSRHRPEAWVLGGDQTLSFEGGLVSKAGSVVQARARLAQMRGKTHELHSGAALARDGQVMWSGVDSARMVMRDSSEAFLDDYVAREGDAIRSCVGAYKLEGLGAQLFETVEGDYFTVLGLPLWPVLGELRRAGVIAS